MLTEHLNHKVQVQGLTAVSICILTCKKMGETTVTIQDLFVDFMFYKCMFLCCDLDVELMLHIKKDLQPKLLCPRPYSSSEALVNAHTSGLQE